MAVKILAVDDEPLYIRLLKVNLEAEGYEVISAQNGEEAVEMITAQSPDLVIMDVMMPIMDGISACIRIRQFSNIPIILLTAMGEEHDRVNGLNIGADDYVVKPFSATEMVARVRAVLRRTHVQSAADPSRTFIHGNLKIDLAKAEIWKNEKQIFLSATEYKLLLYFTHHIGQVLTAEELLEATWGASYKNEKEILWVSIARLRQKLEDNPHSPVHIVTRTGLGYQMPVLSS